MKKTESEKEKKFNILDFSSYKKVEGQYTKQFIKNSRCVKLGESETEVAAAVSQSKSESVELLERAHKPKKITAIFVKDTEFAEFIGKYVDDSERFLIPAIKTAKSFILKT